MILLNSLLLEKRVFRAMISREQKKGKTCSLDRYAALAEWAFKEGIYRKKAFLDEVGLEEDDLNKLFKSTTITARKRKQKIHSSTGNTANAKKKKKHGVDMALPLSEQLVAEFEEEDERLASEANSAKSSATKDTSQSDEERSSEEASY